jgi:hypothetical protein
MKFTTLAALCISTLIMGSANAYSNSDKSDLTDSIDTSNYTNPEMTKQDIDDVERIGVTGKVDTLYFKRQAMMAELDFYELFNAVADEEKFKMKCRKESRTGSRIKTTRCYPQYLLARMSQETQDALSSGAPYPTWEQVEFLVQRDKEEALQYAEKLVQDNPELLNKLVAMHQKQQEYLVRKAAQ